MDIIKGLVLEYFFILGSMVFEFLLEWFINLYVKSVFLFEEGVYYMFVKCMLFFCKYGGTGKIFFFYFEEGKR